MDESDTKHVPMNRRVSDGGLDWEWHRREFRKALSACATASNGVGLSEGQDLFAQLHSCSLLMLNFRHRLSLKQQKDLSELVAACYFDGCELRGDPEWDEEVIRSFFEDAFKHVRGSAQLFEAFSNA